jgi:CO dehydrogenase/acetyl-CoA synthase beta subunit
VEQEKTTTHQSKVAGAVERQSASTLWTTKPCRACGCFQALGFLALGSLNVQNAGHLADVRAAFERSTLALR